MNEALKTKWLWRYAIEDDALQKKLIVSKHGANSFSWGSKRSPYAHRIGCWKYIHASLDFLSLLFVLRREVGLGCHFGMISGAGNL